MRLGSLQCAMSRAENCRSKGGKVCRSSGMDRIAEKIDEVDQEQSSSEIVGVKVVTTCRGFAFVP